MRFFILNEQDANSLTSWWQSLEDNRGERAQLRRCQRADDVLLTGAMVQFLRSMPGYWGVQPGQKGILLTDAAMVATLLARVKANATHSFAKSLALPKEGGTKAAMSALRFEQLQKSRTDEEFFLRISRAIDLVGGKVNVVSLADNILHWLREYRTAPAVKPFDRLAVRWASDYYENLKNND